jgi:hypothetical protein
MLTAATTVVTVIRAHPTPPKSAPVANPTSCGLDAQTIYLSLSGDASLTGLMMIDYPRTKTTDKDAEIFNRTSRRSVARPAVRAIIHSIHSQVPITVASLDQRLDLIVSMDSHLDVSLGGDDSLYPKELRTMARRTGAHTALRHFSRTLGSPEGETSVDSEPRLIVVMPERMLAAHANNIESQLPGPLRISDPQESISSCLDFLKETMGIEVYQSPPRRLTDLVRVARNSGSWILDIDVDYMFEMQSECYTRIIKPEPRVLQTASSVIDFIKKTQPETITLSEAKVAAIRNPRSALSTFIADLRALGYKIEERGVFTSDSEVIKGISVCKEFYRTISKVLMTNHMQEMMKGDFEDFQEQERIAAYRFFRDKGYSA